MSLATVRADFFVRVYRESSRLVDSGEFRYCTDLQEIRVNGKSYSQDMVLAPSSEGHSPTTLQFVGDYESPVLAKLKVGNPYVTIGSDGVATVEPRPEADETTWSLASDSGPGCGNTASSHLVADGSPRA